MDFCNDLRNAIRATGMSSRAMAKKTGVSQVAISQFLRGGQMKTETVSRLINAMGWRIVLRAGAEDVTLRPRP